MKLDPKKVYDSAFYWVGAGESEAAGDGDVGQMLHERRYEIDIIGGVEDKEADYSYDDWALCELDGKYYLLSTSGCSCPSPAETWRVEMGPCTLDEIKKRLLAGEYSGYTVPGKQMDEFLALIDYAAEARS